jgi:spore coat protein A, manganese oxidase
VSHRRLPISPVERFDVVIDFVNLDGGDEVRVIARFGPYSGKYVFHCHNLEHEDMAMMANFEVV